MTTVMVTILLWAAKYLLEISKEYKKNEVDSPYKNNTNGKYSDKFLAKEKGKQESICG